MRSQDYTTPPCIKGWQSLIDLHELANFSRCLCAFIHYCTTIKKRPQVILRDIEIKSKFFAHFAHFSIVSIMAKYICKKEDVSCATTITPYHLSTSSVNRQWLHITFFFSKSICIFCHHYIFSYILCKISYIYNFSNNFHYYMILSNLYFQNKYKIIGNKNWI